MSNKMLLLSKSPDKECELLGDLGILIQIALSVLSFSSLIGKIHIVKRYLEKKKRTWRVWFMDTSKQALSAGILHVLNLYLSSSSESGDHCIVYFLNYIIDTVLGMALCYLFLHLIEKCLQNSEKFSFKSGDYGENAEFGKWAYQISIWIVIILVVKMIIWASMNLFQDPLMFFGEVVLFPVSWNPDLELVSVMVVIPVVSNSIVFWITDSFLKNDKELQVETEFELLDETKKKPLSKFFY
jgi:hypothetical protein